MFTEQAWVTDTDQWKRTSDGAIVTLPNPDTSITDTIRSGHKVSSNANYDSVTGQNLYTYTIDATSPAGTYFDDFQAHDTGAQNTDPPPGINECTVTVGASGPPPSTTGGTTGG